MRNFYLLLAAFVFICGIVLASLGVFASFSPVLLSAFAIILFIPLILFRKNDILFVGLLFLLVFLLGVVRYNAFNRIDKSHIKNYLRNLVGCGGSDVVLIQGRVVSDPEESRAGKKKSFILEAGSIMLKSDSTEKQNRFEKTSGLVLVNTYDREAFAYRYGDIVVLEGTLSRPFSYATRQNFDYREYLGNKRIYSILNIKKGFFSEKIGRDKSMKTRIVGAIYSMRDKIEAHIKNYLKSPHDSILAAILLGKRRGIPKEISGLFARTGTLHILAISGLHVGIIYFALKVILKILRIERNLALVLAVLFLVCFAVMTGARASILRAATMFSILAFSEVLKRKAGIFNLIGLSSLIILLVNPNQVFNAGFILSYAAVLSIVGISPLFYRIFPRGGKLKRLVLVSLSVFIGLAPLTAYYFGLISPIVVAANIIVIPLLLMIMVSGLFFITLGVLLKFLGVIFSQSAWAFLAILINSVKLLASVPFGYFEVEPPHLLAIIAYYIVVCSVILMAKTKN